MHNILGRRLFILSFLGCMALIAAILYFVFIEHLNPCPLCILQQFCLLLLTLITLVALIFNPKKIGVYVFSLLLVCIAGAASFLAMKQLWMQAYPQEYVGSCSAGVNTLFHNLPFLDFLKLLFQGSGDCSVVEWSLWGLSMAGWSLIFFAGFAIAHLVQLLFYKSDHHQPQSLMESQC
ncbi:MAG: disulfide bond formation protein B [Francisellaceae bacterium]